jgi:hypothetical protein
MHEEVFNFPGFKSVLKDQNTYIQMATINSNNKNKSYVGCGETLTLTYCWWECKLVQPLWKAVQRFLKNLWLELPYDPAIPLLGIYPKERKTGHCRDTYTLMCIATLFTITKLWKQPRCPTTDEWIMKLWYIYSMEYYSATRNNNMEFDGKWIQLKGIMLCEVSQDQKHKRPIFSLIQGRYIQR